MMTDRTTPTIERAAWTVEEWASATTISRSTIYRMISVDSIRSVRVGGRRLIITAPTDYLANIAAGTAA